MAHSITTDHESVMWPIQSFAISNDFVCPGPVQLVLDRANAELGLVYQTSPSISVMAQFPDTEEPVYFQVSKARAACTRFNNSCKKVCILMQHFQLDLVFATGAHAADFLQRLGRIATKVGNLHFEVHEAASYVSVVLLTVLSILILAGVATPPSLGQTSVWRRKATRTSRRYPGWRSRTKTRRSGLGMHFSA